MARPLAVEFGFCEAPLPSERPVFVRVLRLAVTLSTPFGAACYAWATPVAVVDRGVSPPPAHPVVDSAALARLLVAALPLAIALARRRSAADRRRKEESDARA